MGTEAKKSPFLGERQNSLLAGVTEPDEVIEALPRGRCFLLAYEARGGKHRDFKAGVDQVGCLLIARGLGYKSYRRPKPMGPVSGRRRHVEGCTAHGDARKVKPDSEVLAITHVGLPHVEHKRELKLYHCSVALTTFEP